MTNKPGTVIILNGPSAAGKSSVQKALQAKMKEPYLCMGIDSVLVGMMPQRYFLGEESDRKEVLWAEFDKDEAGNALFNLYFGSKGRRVIFGMHEAIAAFAMNGNNVIVDYIQYEKEWMPHLMTTLSNIDTYYIGFDLPLEVLEEREIKRATSPKGHARSHFKSVHEGAVYDLRLDTSLYTAEECAIQIAQLIPTEELVLLDEK